MVSKANHEASHYAILFRSLLLLSSQTQTSSSVPCFWSPSGYTKLNCNNEIRITVHHDKGYCLTPDSVGVWGMWTYGDIRVHSKKQQGIFIQRSEFERDTEGVFVVSTRAGAMQYCIAFTIELECQLISCLLSAAKRNNRLH